MRTLVIVTLCFLAAFSGVAQENDPVGENLFPPELIMANQRTIGLTDDQQSSIRSLMKQSQAEFIDLNWEMQELTSRLLGIISQPTVEESKALLHLEKVLNQENEIKKKQFALMIRLKNILTEEQQNQLNALRK